MARKEAIFDVKVNTGDSVNDIRQLDKDMTHLAETIGVEVGASISAMEDKLYDLALAGQQNTEEFKQLQAQTAKYKQIVIETDRSIDQLAEQGRGLSTALSLAEGTVAGFQAFTGVTALLGDENEELLETITKLQAAQGVLNSLEVIKQQLQQNSIKITQTATTVQNLWSKAIGNGSKALKLFRGALIATGIGAIVVGIGLLVANFQKVVQWVNRAKKAFEDSGVVIKTLLFPITILIEAYNKVVEVLQKLGIVESEESKARKKRVEENIKNIEKERNAVGERFDFEIAKAKASGKNTLDLERQKREAVIESVKAQIKEILKLAALNQEITDEQKKAIEELKQEAKKAQQEQTLSEITEQTKRTDEAKKQAEKRAQERAKRQEEERKLLQAHYLKLQELRNEALDAIAEAEEEFLTTSREKEENEVRDKYFELIALAEQYGEDTTILREAQNQALQEIDDRYRTEEAQRRLNFERQLDDILQENRILSASENLDELEQIERDKLTSKYERLIEDTLANETLLEEEKTALLVALKEQEELELQAVEDNFREQRKAKEEQEQKERIDRANQYLEAVGQSLSAISSLSDTLTEIQLQNVEKGSEAEEKIRRKAFERNKKIQIATAIINGIQAVQNALGSAPAPFNFALATITGAQAIANVVKIKGQKYEGGSAGSLSSNPTGATAQQVNAQGDNLNSEQTFLNADGTQQNQQQGGTFQVVVVESDITDTQENVKKINTKSTF